MENSEAFGNEITLFKEPLDQRESSNYTQYSLVSLLHLKLEYPALNPSSNSLFQIPANANCEKKHGDV